MQEVVRPASKILPRLVQLRSLQQGAGLLGMFGVGYFIIIH